MHKKFWLKYINVKWKTWSKNWHFLPHLNNKFITFTKNNCYLFLVFFNFYVKCENYYLNLLKSSWYMSEKYFIFTLGSWVLPPKIYINELFITAVWPERGSGISPVVVTSDQVFDSKKKKEKIKQNIQLFYNFLFYQNQMHKDHYNNQMIQKNHQKYTFFFQKRQPYVYNDVLLMLRVYQVLTILLNLLY